MLLCGESEVKVSVLKKIYKIRKQFAF